MLSQAPELFGLRSGRLFWASPLSCFQRGPAFRKEMLLKHEHWLLKLFTNSSSPDRALDSASQNVRRTLLPIKIASAVGTGGEVASGTLRAEKDAVLAGRSELPRSCPHVSVGAASREGHLTGLGLPFPRRGRSGAQRRAKRSVSCFIPP